MKRYQKSTAHRPKVVSLDSHSLNQKKDPRVKSQSKQKSSFKVKRGRLIALTGCVLLGLSLGSLVRTYQRHQRAQQDMAQIEATLHLTQGKFDQVKAEHERSQDPDYLAKVARRDYYYSKEGELIFDIHDDGEEVDHQVFQEEDRSSIIEEN